MRAHEPPGPRERAGARPADRVHPLREARRLQDGYVSTEHLVLAMPDESPAGASGLRLAKQRAGPVLTEPARPLVASEGYDPVHGARPPRRFIAHEVEPRIGRALLSGEAREDVTAVLGTAGGELTVAFQDGPPEPVPVDTPHPGSP
ncbi:Clp protease N-terminal domain-containing protein [Streptomyces sp. NPDC001985]|uniref:Clp protease N-terminal domain-containing protein n=1 Tax=Streptomyces sp. NPDC001985 TaxID=3154406 RepID=UPI00331C5068